jgi:hypothetical protein
VGKGNGAYKIAPMWEKFEIPWYEATLGDMIIFRDTGQWDRIKTISGSNIEEFDGDIMFTTKFGKEVHLSEVMVVRY